MKKRKNKIPAFIINNNTAFGQRNAEELRKQRENQKKLMLNNKNHKY